MSRSADRRREELRATLLLDGLPGLGPAKARRLLDAYGSARAALAAVRAGSVPLRDDARRAAFDQTLADRVERGLERADRLGISTLLPYESGYPARLDRLTDPPTVLFAAGDLALLRRPAVAVVGSRQATPRARTLARRLARAVSASDTTVVSGLALGVDGEAHRGALEASGSTIAVLGCGPDRAYPPANRGLFHDVRDRGLILSEFLPGTPALRHHFPRRNRILAALAHTVVVVEARARSGALITVEHALDLGLDVWAVPGPIDEATCDGSNALLADGARALVSVERFVVEVAGGASTPDVRAPRDPEMVRVLAVLDGCPGVDDVAAAVGLDVGGALALLSRMELEGWVERAPGLRFKKAG